MEGGGPPVLQRDKKPSANKVQVNGLGTLAPPETEGQLSIYRGTSKIVSMNNYSLDIISKVI